MKYGSVCSGIEAASVAWHPLGWRAAWFAEVEPYPCAVLAHHYPDVPNLGDMTKYKDWPDADIDVLVGGTPCQSFSVAGLRTGMADPRGNLALTYIAIADKYRPRWLVWENVPGVLSSNRGRDFGAFVGGLVQLGYGFAYRVLDAQYFGVAQRRRRVFVVAYLGDWRRAAAVLFEQHSLSGHPAPRRDAGERVAECLSASPASNCSPNVANGQGTVVEVHAFDAFNQDSTGDLSKTVSARNDQDTASLVAVKQAMQVRRLMPVECERLQGFPDDYTAVPWNNKPASQCPDGPRYRAIGNSMAVPVMQWIGQRIGRASA